MSRLLATTAAALLLAASATALAQHTLEIVEDNGPSDNRIDLVLMGDGYTAAQQDDLVQDTGTALEAIFDKAVYEEYRPFYNFVRISTVSPESGADHPAENDYVDSFFDCMYDCAGLDRLICCDHELIIGVAAELYPAFDYVLLVVNDSEYGGSGGLVAITSSSPLAFDVPPHEFGHTIGALGDEYDDPYPAWECEDIFPNVSPTYEPDELKWFYWVEDGTPLPTPDSAATGDLEPVGAYEGACYEPSGWYRPVWSCLMRNLNSDFCSVCAEQMVLTFHGFVEPIDSHDPAEEAVSGAYDDVIEFRVEAVEPEPSTIEFRWLVDDAGVADADDGALELPLAAVEVGEHLVEVVVRNATDLVREDPDGLTEQTVSWILTREPEPDGPADGSPPASTAITALSPGGCDCAATGARLRPRPSSLVLLLKKIFG